MRFSREGISNCKRCPLRDRHRVWGEGPEDGDIWQAFLGEAPGEQEDLKGHPFVGPSGGLFSKGLTEASTERFRCWVFNLIGCRPTGNKLDSFEGEEALSCCKSGFQAEIAFLEKRHLRVLTPLGGKPLAALGIETSITKARGSVYEIPGKKLLAVPTFHPSFLLHGMQKEIPTWIADLKKARELASKPYKKLREDFNLFPSLGELEDFVNEALEKKSTIGVDIETIGIRADYSKIVVIGLATSGERAISVPFLCRGLVPYWKNGDEYEAIRLVNRLLSVAPTIYQNALFDILHLREHGFKIGPATDDVLLAHHAIHPELPHNLGYIVSIYGKTPYWKDSMKLREDVVANMEDEVLRRYNLRDSVVLHQVLPEEVKDMKIMKTEKIYREISVPLIEVLCDMTRAGITLDRKALEAWKRGLTKKKKKLEAEIFSELKLPEAFNLSSGDHLRFLLYNAMPNQFARALETLKSYEDPSRKKPLRKDTKKYKELVEIATISRYESPLWFNIGKLKTTVGGSLSVDEEALLGLRLNAVRRKHLVENFIHPDDDDRDELERIKNTLWFLEKFSSYQETSKLLSTYSDFPTWKDGKVHTSFMIHGTKTGRLASRDPNLQNIPKEARKLFKARPGHVFIEADYSNLEPRILAYVSGDKESIKTFEAGKNIHDQNTIALFPEAKKTDADWGLMRMAAKKYRLAMNYGGGLYHVYQKVCLEVPGLDLSFQQFKEAHESYTAKHPQETEWLEKTADLAVETRELRNIFGRVRIFLGTESEIRREGVNFPIQGSAADIIAPAMIALHATLKTWKSPAPKLLLQVHDSLLVETPVRDIKKTVAAMKSFMQKPVKIGKREVIFPVEFKISEPAGSWGEMKDLK
jgi:uracil-DNA glycosylase family 4